jgi:hypothetical protein
MNYAHIAKPAINPEPGFSDFFFIPTAELETIRKPTAPFTAPGDTQTIKTAHVPVDGKGAYRVYQLKEKHTAKGDTAGSFGSKTLKNEVDLFMPGFDAERLEFVKSILNEYVLTWSRDANCDLDTLIQYGNECRPAEIDANYTIGTFEPTGEKGFFLKVKWTGIPYVYAATLPIFEAGS